MLYRAYSACKAFKAMLCEVNDLAGQHEVIAENLQSDVIREINHLVKDIKEERKKVCVLHLGIPEVAKYEIGMLDYTRYMKISDTLNIVL